VEPKKKDARQRPSLKVHPFSFETFVKRLARQVRSIADDYTSFHYDGPRRRDIGTGVDFVNIALSSDKETGNIDEDHNIGFSSFHLQRRKSVIFYRLITLFVKIRRGWRSLERSWLLGGEGQPNL
jgi:translation elongation factor EF-1beta